MIHGNNGAEIMLMMFLVVVKRLKLRKLKLG